MLIALRGSFRKIPKGGGKSTSEDVLGEAVFNFEGLKSPKGAQSFQGVGGGEANMKPWLCNNFT